jgi:hypothetical protein
VATTSFAVNGWPSWNFTFGRSLKVQTSPLSFGFHDSASAGLSTRCSPSSSIRNSPVWFEQRETRGIGDGERIDRAGRRQMRDANRRVRGAGAPCARACGGSERPPPASDKSNHARIAQQLAARQCGRRGIRRSRGCRSVGTAACSFEREESIRGSLHRWGVQSVLIGAARLAHGRGDGIAMAKSGFSVSDWAAVRNVCGR